MITKTTTIFGDVPGTTNTIQRIKLIIVLETKAMGWLIRSQHEGLLGYMETEESFVILGERRYEFVITDDLSIAFQPLMVSSG